MSSPTEKRDFMATIDSIQVKFMESLITGRRDVAFGKGPKEERPQPETELRSAQVDSSGTIR